ncbi:3-oxoacyl-ACP synthase III family protein [Lentzea kentuckyensis]|uniref:3-oxoacyl-ACP synthase III family protein n=1 Tax=Lentzea kentuckyensis TaxID=360086 RepID=UPI000A3630F2|nr:3-oxoacyl-ACP synthase III family protein [Lentzea kentuckyensis]
MSTPAVHILSTGTALPGPRIDNATLAQRFGMSVVWQQWVDEFIATHSRHLSTNLDTGEIDHTLTDLGEEAGRRAMSAAGVSSEDIDLVVMGTATPDLLMPATVNMIADRLGIDGVPTYQLQSGCAGAVQALDVACRLVASGRHRTALVLGGDVGAKHHDLTTDLGALSPAELVNVVLFGDGAGAAVISATPSTGSAAVREVFVRLTGLNRPPGQVIEWFGLADRGREKAAGSEDYKMIEHSVPVMAAEIVEELLGITGWQESDVDYLLPPQLSGTMTRKIVERMKMPDAEEITCVREIGNNGNALVFFQLDRLLPRMTAGQHALGVAVESSKWIKAGFALEKL